MPLVINGFGESLEDVDYALNQKTPQANSYKYNFFFEKQSGTENDPVNIEIISASKDMPIKTSLGSIDGSLVKVSTTNDFDREVVVNFVR